MFRLTVTQLKTGREGVVSATHKQVVIDHLEASARRNGLGVTNHGDGGSVFKDGREVGVWKVVQE
ncbi:hypothetical protein SEA_ORANGE_93 [Mycobacterium phage Orange]|nr:hypothetical protein SEA_EBONY_92 [Mycobacterium phage Ebony]AXC33549.1 hypothetical protein SEA_JOSELITO_91 [Mycobacterium phage Joselito]QBI97917.1 hypothetical protein SEA_ORANGE_93 [Mycobacterium phage Orange]QBI98255.1 hypothetical protein SEA_BOWTIE_89 [Mycobacterium phage Bowtie]QBI98461.1 hypothetical protein SEA_MUNCH_92 [Mycobacterium phage Munch]QGZ16508.1 hypothetical protein SEA_ANEEM_94 [Mycobacterium phage Aneem]QHJ86601.1 hypothetical protein SEA_MABEL_93 [Mycobacterium pha